jgi:hypothetical protein
MMSKDPVGAYKDATANLAEATQKAETMVADIGRFAHLLQGWKTVGLANSPGFSADGAGPVPTTTINMQSWPSAQQLQNALVTWRSALQVVNSAWLAVPEHLRKGLPAPPPT